MAATIRDVARIAGVSISTVSKVMNQSHTISQPTIDKVERAIKSLNYVPDQRGRNLVQKRTDSIAFVTGVHRGMAFENPHLFEIMMGAQKTLADRSYHMEVIGLKHRDPNAVRELVQSGRVDGILLHVSVLTPDLAKDLVKWRFPHAVIGMPDFPNGVSWIDNNNNLSGQLAVKHLLSIERERIAFIGGKAADHISGLRLEGIEEELRHHMMELPLERIITTNSMYQDGYDATVRLLAQDERPDAIICANNVLDLGCINALNDHGVNIPEDIAVVTFDDYPYAIITNPPTTAINIDVYDLGQQAARLLLEKIQKPNVHFQTFMTVPLLVVRESTTKAL